MLARVEPLPELREPTSSAHQTCVERVIHTLRDQPAHMFSLAEMAGIAYMSPFHFNRVFRKVTGLPPRVFQCLLRIEAAKRMLLTTGMTITDVCLETGYSSVGTFTRRFGEMVGVPPSTFRRLLDEPARPPHATDAGPGGEPADPSADATIRGIVRVPPGFTGRVFIGAFRGPIPRGRPAGCAVLATPADTFRIEGLERGSYHVAGAAIAHRTGAPENLLHEDILRASCGPVAALGGMSVLAHPLFLRPAEVTDAPILIPFGPAFDAGIIACGEPAPYESSNLGEAAQPPARRNTDMSISHSREDS